MVWGLMIAAFLAGMALGVILTGLCAASRLREYEERYERLKEKRLTQEEE